MKKKVITLIVIFASISLVGIVFTQLYWVKKSMELKEEQFDNSTRIALKSVINRLLDHSNDPVTQQYLNDLSSGKPRLEVTDIIAPPLLDSILHEELESMMITDDYYYGIYSGRSQKFVAGNYSGKKDELLSTSFQFSLSNLYKPGNYYLSIYFPDKRSILLRQMEIWLLLSVFFLIVLIISFFYVIYSILHQKKVSEMKTDFINNMTHEFKTPIATSSLAAEMILRAEMIKHPERIRKYAKVILDENGRLQNQVEQVMQIASLEKGKQRIKMKKTSIHSVIDTVLESIELRLKENDVNLSVELNAKNYQVQGDKLQLQNVLYNLLDNAIKYSPEKPTLKIKTWNKNKSVVFSVQDNGVGIDPVFQKNIFNNLYRIPMGNIHDVRGFGLGLYYVKNVVEFHHGKISIDSESGKGSTFDVYLPFD